MIKASSNVSFVKDYLILPCLCSYATTCIFDCSSEGSVDIETTTNDDDVAETIDGPLEARNEPRSLINFNWTFLEAPEFPRLFFKNLFASSPIILEISDAS